MRRCCPLYTQKTRAFLGHWKWGTWVPCGKIRSTPLPFLPGQLEQAASARELQEAALLEGLTQAAMPTEEEVLLAADSWRPGLSQLIQRLQGLPDSALSEPTRPNPGTWRVQKGRLL